MAYDDTSFYGDLICNDYDEENNFMNPQSSMGALVYYLLGHSFDMMADMNTQFMNDTSILTANTKGLDNFWGVSYNMPRPSVDTLGSIVFEDKGTIFDYTNWSYSNNMTIVRTNAYSYTQNTDATAFGYVAQTIASGDTVEVDVCISGLATSSAFVSIRKGTTSVGTVSLSNLGLRAEEWGHMKLIFNGTSMNVYCNDVFKMTKTLSADDYNRIQFSINANTTYTQKFKNFVIYDMDTPSTRPMTDEEYRIYLYLRNCRLLTMEDLEINFNKCFAYDDYEVYFSTETNYFDVVDHINYQSNENITSNITKNVNDDTNEYLIDFENESEDVKIIEGMLSKIEEEILIINIPFNNYDSNFLQFLEPYISVKGNVKIKEYNI